MCDIDLDELELARILTELELIINAFKIYARSYQTSTINIADLPEPRVVGPEEIIYDKVIELEEQMKIINKKLDELLGERQCTY